MSEADKLEIWRDIRGYEGKFQVSNYGRVKSLKRVLTRSNGHKQTINEKILKPSVSNKGYYMVGLDGKTCTIHRLVAETFLDELVVNHKNGIKTDNRIDNLEFVSQKDNTIKAWKMGLCEKTRQALFNRKQKSNISTSKRVVQFDMNGNIIEKFESIRQAERATGISNSNIIRCCKKIQTQTKGFRFEYENDAQCKN